MTFLMSDLHGQYDKYYKMLEMIGFSDQDDFYILGDIHVISPSDEGFLIFRS